MGVGLNITLCWLPQMDGMAKMRNITELLQSRALKVIVIRDPVMCIYSLIHCLCSMHVWILQDKKEKSRDAMRQLLSQEAYRSVMCNVVSILNPKLK